MRAASPTLVLLVGAALASSCAGEREPVEIARAPLDFVPNELQQPGTQPGEVSGLESPNKCDNCHGGYSVSVEPAHNWRGGMMAHSARDPVFRAAPGPQLVRCGPHGQRVRQIEPYQVALGLVGDGVATQLQHDREADRLGRLHHLLGRRHQPLAAGRDAVLRQELPGGVLGERVGRGGFGHGARKVYERGVGGTTRSARRPQGR